MGDEVWQALLVLLVTLALLLGLVKTIDNVEMLVLVGSLHGISVGARVGALVERMEVWRRLAA